MGSYIQKLTFPPSHRFIVDTQKNNQITKLVRQMQTQALHYAQSGAGHQDLQRHSANTVGSGTCGRSTNSGVIEGTGGIAKGTITSPVLARPKKDVASSCVGQARTKALSPRGVSPRMGQHLMPELNGSIWRPMSPLESSPIDTMPVRPFASGRPHPDATSTPGSKSKSSRSRMLRQLSTGQEAESWAAEVLRSIDF